MTCQVVAGPNPRSARVARSSIRASEGPVAQVGRFRAGGGYPNSSRATDEPVAQDSLELSATPRASRGPVFLPSWVLLCRQLRRLHLMERPPHPPVRDRRRYQVAGLPALLKVGRQLLPPGAVPVEG